MMKKRVIATLLATVMLFGTLTACGTETPVANNGNAAATGSETITGGEATNEKANISIMTLDFSGQALAGEKAPEVIEKMSDYTNTNVEWKFVMSDAYDDKLTLELASGDEMAMVLTVQKMNSQVANYARAGAFWDLSEFINEEDYPNLAKANPDINNHLTVDGKLIGIYRGRTVGRYGLGYRTDWAEKLGYTEMPRTIDEVYDMMYDMTYGDPDGNGKDDTYAMELCSYMGPFDVMQTWFGVGNGWYEDAEGKLMPVHMQDEYFEALNWFKKCYDEGLFASDFATRETGNWSDDCKNGLAGMYCDTVSNSRKIWEYYTKNNIPSVMDPTTTATMTLCESIGKTADDVHNLANLGYGGFLVITKEGAKTEEDVKNCLHYLDKMCDDEMMMLATYGLEGVHWEKDANNYYVDITTNKDKQQYDFAGINQVLAYVPNLDVTEDYILFDRTDAKKKELETVAANTEYAISNPAASLLLQSETYSMSGANLDLIISDARINYIIGNITEEQLRAEWDRWYTSGGSKIIEEVNAVR